MAAGDYSAPSTHVLVARFGADGGIAWQHGFATPNAKGGYDDTAEATSIVQTPDGGYAIAGGWRNGTFNSNAGADGALLLKLGSDGNLQWQKAHSGGVYCFFNGFSETCTDVGGYAYSVHLTSDGGYLLAGNSNLEMTDGAPIEAW